MPILQVGAGKLDFNYSEAVFSIWWQSGEGRGMTRFIGGSLVITPARTTLWPTWTTDM